MFNHFESPAFSCLRSRYPQALDSRNCPYVVVKEERRKEERERERERERVTYRKVGRRGEESGVHLVKQRSLYGAPRLLALLIRGRKCSGGNGENRPHGLK